ncbi:hypothetical protein V8C35DRAFT_309895 [Trichoderma chlorosporum]
MRMLPCTKINIVNKSLHSAAISPNLFQHTSIFNSSYRLESLLSSNRPLSDRILLSIRHRANPRAADCAKHEQQPETRHKPCNGLKTPSDVIHHIRIINQSYLRYPRPTTVPGSKSHCYAPLCQGNGMLVVTCVLMKCRLGTQEYWSTGPFRSWNDMENETVALESHPVGSNHIAVVSLLGICSLGMQIVHLEGCVRIAIYIGTYRHCS